MSKSTTIKAAIATFEKAQSAEKGQTVVASEIERVDLSAQVPPIEKMDAALNTLRACRKLHLSTNNIERIANLGSLTQLELLSLGRNLIKKVEGFDGLGQCLKELWISYNLLEKLGGIEKLEVLRVFYASNNRIKDWADIDVLAKCSALRELVLMGNPIVPAPGTPEYRTEVLKRLPNLQKLDGTPLTQDERDVARGGPVPVAPRQTISAVQQPVAASG